MSTSNDAASRPEINFLNHPKGVKSWLLTLDHKRIGIMYLIAIAFAFAAGGLFAMLIRLELMRPGAQFVSQDVYNQLFTLHGAIMVFLVIIPSIPAALGNFCLPLMLGAKDVAFPRLNLASWYVYMTGAGFALYALVLGRPELPPGTSPPEFVSIIDKLLYNLLGQAADTGWTFYTPYSAHTNTSVISLTAGAFIIGFSSIFTGLNFIVTIHKMRAPGMHWYTLPLFAWGIYATSIIQILATPVLGITLLLLILERVGGIGIFDPAMGGDPVLFQHFFWFYSHPAVYIMILPGMAIISELIAVHSHKKIFGYRLIAYSSVAIALLGFFVWGHHMFISGQSEFSSMVFSFITFFIGIPTAIKIFNWMTTLVRGTICLTTPMLYALAFIILFTIGGLTGVFLGALGLDVHLHDTYFVVAHFHYVMMGGTIIAFLGGIHHWWPKIFGKMYSEFWGRIAFVFVFFGFNMTFFNQFMLGSQGMPRRYHDYSGFLKADLFERYHAFSSYGAFTLGAGFLIVAAYLLASLINGKPAGNNPWGGLTMEWATTSPPPTENFPGNPVCTHGPYDYDQILPEQIGMKAG